MVTVLNPQVDSPPFAATVVAAVPLQLYQEDPVYHPSGLSTNRPIYLSTDALFFKLRKKTQVIAVVHRYFIRFVMKE